MVKLPVVLEMVQPQVDIGAGCEYIMFYNYITKCIVTSIVSWKVAVNR